MKCKKCGSTFYVDFDPFQGIIEPECPRCGYPYRGSLRRSEKIMEYLMEKAKKLNEGKERRDA